VLEHRHLHKAVIFLVRLFLQSTQFNIDDLDQIVTDAACVLADLTYTFLSEGCNPPEGEDSPAWLEVLAHISLGITTFFLVEIPLSLFAFGLRFYNPFGSVPHAVLHLFDAFIILTTFILEVVLRGREQELASLLIILRLWRLVKLVGGDRLHFCSMMSQLNIFIKGSPWALAKWKNRLSRNWWRLSENCKAS
jgi:hypothetical protein